MGSTDIKPNKNPIIHFAIRHQLRSPSFKPELVILLLVWQVTVVYWPGQPFTKRKETQIYLLLTTPVIVNPFKKQLLPPQGPGLPHTIHSTANTSTASSFLSNFLLPLPTHPTTGILSVQFLPLVLFCD